jgi:hypothetical protein
VPLEGFESQKRRIDDQISELRAMLPGGSIEPAATPEAPTRKRKISAAARRRMAISQKERWAKIRGESEPPAPATAEATKPKRKLSKAGKAAIVAALKKRWALKRAEAAKTTTKKAAPTKKKGTTKKAAVKASPAKAAKKSAPPRKRH